MKAKCIVVIVVTTAGVLLALGILIAMVTIVGKSQRIGEED